MYSASNCGVNCKLLGLHKQYILSVKSYTVNTVCQLAFILIILVYGQATQLSTGITLLLAKCKHQHVNVYNSDTQMFII